MFLVQTGQHPLAAKPLKGMGSAVIELADDFGGDTYRMVYTVRFSEAVYVLHAFKKKSKRGIRTPQIEVRPHLAALAGTLSATMWSDMRRTNDE